LFEPVFPARLESLHPFAVFQCVGDIYNQEGQFVPKKRFFMPPMPLGNLFLEGYRVELLNNFVDGFTQHFLGYV
jgi:hypothetical protein